MMRPKSLFLLLLSLLAVSVDAQSTIAGIAVDSRLKRPLPCVQVRLLGPDSAIRESTRASTTGRFEFIVRDTGSYHLRFDAWGFNTVITGEQRIVPGQHSEKMYGMWLYPFVPTDDYTEPDPWYETPPRWLRTVGPVPELVLEHVGDVFARFAVDSSGRVDTTSIVMIRADSPDMEKTARRMLARSVWAPGRIGERPVCDLVGQSFVFNRP